MRIIGGKHRGVRLRPTRLAHVRPTTDKAKEGLFNVLIHQFDLEDFEVLDLFTGTGSIALEFVSRGAGKVTAVDVNYKSIAFLNEKAKDLRIENLTGICKNVYSFLRNSNQKFDLIFADPPYNLKGFEEIPKIINDSGLLRPESLFILEHPDTMSFVKSDGFSEVRRYGKVSFSFFYFE